MSRRKDRERFLAMKDLDADYRGFRGYHEEHTEATETPLQTVTCSVCGRKRNVSVDDTEHNEDGYVCLSCREEMAQGEPEPQAPETGTSPKPQSGSGQSEHP